MKRPKYHFLVAVPNGSGRSIVTLPGQSFGRLPVPDDVLVKDEKGKTAVSCMRRKAGEGELFFTTSLRRLPGGGLVASDIHRLCNVQDIMYSDAMDEYEKYEKKQTQKP